MEKSENEITVRVTCSNEELIKCLKRNGFNQGISFSLDDHYLIPKDLNLEVLTVREILAKAVIVRYIVDEEKIVQKITFKKKNINESGEIVSQKVYNCGVLDYKAAIKLFEEIGYYEIMEIKEEDLTFEKNGLELSIKLIENSSTLIEIETNDKYTTIEELKDEINKIKVPIEKDNYFVKKAEEALEKLLERK